MITFQRYQEALEAIYKAKGAIEFYQKIVDDYLIEHKDHESFNIEELPPYVSMGKTDTNGGSELRLMGSVYYRDAGIWEVGFYKKNGKLYSIDSYGNMEWLNNQELVPITKEEWEKGNEGYIGGKGSIGGYFSDYRDEEYDPLYPDDLPF